jgi:hypothetical protein
VCVCVWGGGGGCCTTLFLYTPPYFSPDSSSNQAKTTLHWSPISSMWQALLFLKLPYVPIIMFLTDPSNISLFQTFSLPDAQEAVGAMLRPAGLPHLPLLWRRNRFRLHLPPHGAPLRRLRKEVQVGVLHIPRSPGIALLVLLHNGGS